MDDDESGNAVAARELRVGIVFGNCDQRECVPSAHVKLQFPLRIGDFWRKTLLIDLPEGFEIFESGIANLEGHPSIVVFGR